MSSDSTNIATNVVIITSVSIVGMIVSMYLIRFMFKGCTQNEEKTKSCVENDVCPLASVSINITSENDKERVDE